MNGLRRIKVPVPQLFSIIVANDITGSLDDKTLEAGTFLVGATRFQTHLFSHYGLMLL